MVLFLASLPDELQGSCAAFLDVPSAGRFRQANRACERLVLSRLLEAKTAHDAALAARAAETRANAAPPRRIAFTDAGKAFIDDFLEIFVSASPMGRKLLVQNILLAAAARVEELGAEHWTASKVFSRLSNMHKLRNQAA